MIVDLGHIRLEAMKKRVGGQEGCIHRRYPQRFLILMHSVSYGLFCYKPI